MTQVLNLTELDQVLHDQYRATVSNTWPQVILDSPVTQKYWPRLESYFPAFQLFLVDNNDQLIGFINTVPFHWDNPLDDLPEEGWDWQFEKGIQDYEQDIKPNCIGGLQVIITSENKGKGFSKKIIEAIKKLKNELELDHLVIPIRPTFKHKFPYMSMEAYMSKKDGQEIYDPWIRTHLKAGAEIIKVCKKSMMIAGDVAYWERLTKQKIKSSGAYLIPGGLNPVQVNVEKNYGEYREENIWVKHS